ncbi:bZIP transcription factor [Medicago truncatula]|uniref:BZIP transcription factor n=1 Tax=Medicago truncatula TaxID=3880 RepID=A0A072TVR3_MEDTR|nr:bZIP transcription factor [Medicago truncatula]
MDQLEQKVDELREEVTRLRAEIERLTDLVSLVTVTKDHLQVQAPPRVRDKLPAWYQSDLSCAFHQGAPGHDIEHCYALKAEIHKLVQA